MLDPRRGRRALRRAPARRSTAAASSSCAAPSRPRELPELLAGVDVAVMPSHVVGLRAAGGRRVPGRARARCVGRALGGLAEVVRDERRRPGLRRPLDARRPRAPRSTAWPPSRACSSACRPGSRRRAPFAAYVDELEAYYAGERPSRSAVDTGRARRRLAGRPRPAHEPVAHQQRGRDRSPGRASSAWTAPARRSTARCPTRPTSRCATSGRPTCARRARAAWRSSSPGSSARSPPTGSSRCSATSTSSGCPSQFVRRMYLDAGLEDDRVHVVPNGVDLERFAPDGPAYALDAPPALRFLFVGGAIARKGVDVLLAAWREAFAGRDDVHARDQGLRRRRRLPRRRPQRRPRRRAGALPRVVYLDADLADAEMAALYRACDVLVHPYRGEGFAMPVLEAMACGLPVIVTAGGPTDEFCPPQAGWRIRAQRRRDARRARRPLRDDRRAVDARARSRAPGRAPARGRRRRRRRAPPAAPSAARPPCTSAGSASPASTPSAPAPWPRARPRIAASDRVLDGAPSRPRHAGVARPRTSCPRCCAPGRRRRPAPACTSWPTPPPTARPPSSRRASWPPPRASTSTPAPTSRSCASTRSPGATRRCTPPPTLYVPLHDACAGHVRLAGDGVVAPADLGLWLAARSTPQAA